MKKVIILVIATILLLITIGCNESPENNNLNLESKNDLAKQQIYDDYFAVEKPRIDTSTEFYGDKNHYYFVEDNGLYFTDYIITDNGAVFSNINTKVLNETVNDMTFCKDKLVMLVNNQHFAYLNADDWSYEIFYSSNEKITHFFGFDEVIYFMINNTVYRLHIPTGITEKFIKADDVFEKSVEVELIWMVSNTKFSIVIEDPEYVPYKHQETYEETGLLENEYEKLHFYNTSYTYDTVTKSQVHYNEEDFDPGPEVYDSDENNFETNFHRYDEENLVRAGSGIAPYMGFTAYGSNTYFTSSGVACASSCLSFEVNLSSRCLAYAYYGYRYYNASSIPNSGNLYAPSGQKIKTGITFSSETALVSELQGNITVNSHLRVSDSITGNIHSYLVTGLDIRKGGSITVQHCNVGSTHTCNVVRNANVTLKHIADNFNKIEYIYKGY